jgi:succinate-semialdehyde dehydrogenase/glutarate-semialdehyde dehydrogenase
LFIEAGGDEDLFHIACGNSKTIGKELLQSKTVIKITFTGSTKVGKYLMKESAETIKKVSLELGGNAPFIVFDNVNVDKAVDGLLTSEFRNSGQVCIAPNRVFVHKNIKVEFLAKLTKAVLALTQGNGLDNAVKVGPLISQASVEKVQAHVNNAIANGAKLICGGKVDFKLGNIVNLIECSLNSMLL